LGAEMNTVKVRSPEQQAHRDEEMNLRIKEMQVFIHQCHPLAFHVAIRPQLVVFSTPGFQKKSTTLGTQTKNIKNKSHGKSIDLPQFPRQYRRGI
jgi:hypothetical protein